jgi:hypothetical protein
LADDQEARGDAPLVLGVFSPICLLISVIISNERMMVSVKDEVMMMSFMVFFTFPLCLSLAFTDLGRGILESWVFFFFGLVSLHSIDMNDERASWKKNSNEPVVSFISHFGYGPPHHDGEDLASGGYHGMAF